MLSLADTDFGPQPDMLNGAMINNIFRLLPASFAFCEIMKWHTICYAVNVRRKHKE